MINHFALLTCDSMTTKRAFLLVGIATLALAFAACGDDARPADLNHSAAAPASSAAEAAREGTRIFEQYRALDKSKDSSLRMQVRITEGGQTRPFEMRISRKREADGSVLMFSEFLAPAEERDRNALLTLQPQGDIEGTRYIQSNDSFATVKGATGEDSLFGLTVQEMVDGQPEKYDFALVGEEQVNNAPVYRLEGKLKKGADSKFPRLVTLVAKDSFVVLGAEFYDNKNELQRRVTVSNIEQINGYWTRMRWTIDNPARQRKIEFEVKEARYDQNLSPALFTREHLKKTAFKPI